MTLTFVMALALPGLLCAAIIAVLRGSEFAAALADRPNERSLHAVPTARIGGIGIMSGALPVAVTLGPEGLLPVFSTAMALAAVSLADDLKGLPVAPRLAAHALAAAIAVFTLAPPSPTASGVLIAIALVVAIGWMTNLFNFMDGADGLAGGMAAVGFAALAIAALRAGDGATACASAAVAGAALGFLGFNFPPARVFMGDAGSIPLGFLAGALAVHGTARNLWPAWFAPLVFSPFIVDASVTLVRRVARGESWWRAHRTHCYQRLVLAGWSHRRLATGAYALMATCAVVALWAREASPPWRFGILLASALAYPLLLIAIERRVAGVNKPAQGAAVSVEKQERANGEWRPSTTDSDPQ